jgi:hypothetical protein
LDEPNLFAVCSLAFLVVFVLLAFLAAAMHVITTAFPPKKAVLDSAVVAAVSSTVATLIPGARVTKIEEEQ